MHRRNSRSAPENAQRDKKSRYGMLGAAMAQHFLIHRMCVGNAAFLAAESFCRKHTCGSCNRTCAQGAQDGAQALRHLVWRSGFERPPGTPVVSRGIGAGFVSAFRQVWRCPRGPLLPKVLKSDLVLSAAAGSQHCGPDIRRIRLPACVSPVSASFCLRFSPGARGSCLLHHIPLERIRLLREFRYSKRIGA